MTSCKKNNDCDKSYESCALFLWTGGDGNMKSGNRCIPSVYCDMNGSNADKLTYKAFDIAGKIMCSEGKKKDITAAKKPAVVIPKTLKLLQAGHRCKTQTKLISKVEEAALQKKIDDK
jgi:hypothetical protein